MGSAGEMIRKARKEQKKTLSQVADEADLSVSFLSHLERGTRGATEDTFRKLAEVLNIPERELLLAAGYMTDTDKRELFFQFDKDYLAQTIRKMEAVLYRTLEEMTKDGFFEDNDYKKYPFNLISGIFMYSGALEELNDSEYGDLYDALIRDEMSVKEVVEEIASDAKKHEDPASLISEETSMIIKEISPYYVRREPPEGPLFLPIRPKDAPPTIDLFNYAVASEHRFNEKHPSGMIAGKVHSFPINNVYSHLTDPLNHKLYKNITLSVEDREEIIRLIDAFLLHKYVDAVDDEEQHDFIANLTEKPEVILEFDNSEGTNSENISLDSESDDENKKDIGQYW